MASLWGAMESVDEYGLNDLDGVDLRDTQWGYSDPKEATCPDLWDLLNLDKFFKLTKEGEKNVKKFNTTRYSYRWR